MIIFNELFIHRSQAFIKMRLKMSEKDNGGSAFPELDYKQPKDFDWKAYNKKFLEEMKLEVARHQKAVKRIELQERIVAVFILAVFALLVTLIILV